MTRYEWDIETVAKDGDVLDHNFIGGALPRGFDLTDMIDGDENTLVLVLVKDTSKTRSWWYPATETKCFENGDAVPLRFMAQYTRCKH